MAFVESERMNFRPNGHGELFLEHETSEQLERDIMIAVVVVDMIDRTLADHMRAAQRMRR